jgi:hypothetical protein
MTGGHTLTNGLVDLVVSVNDGLRISRYGFVGSANLLASAGNRSTPTRLGPWRPLGGHRLWVAPESMPGSYAPDALPVAIAASDARAAEFTQPVDGAGIEKRMRVEMAAAGSRVVVTHSIVNRTCWPVRIAPWAISIVDGRASAYLPQPPIRSHTADFLPARATVQWSYTDLRDPRWAIGPRLIRLTPDRSKTQAQKIGAGNAAGWCAVHLDDQVFIKRFEWRAGESYPDLGCNNELFTIEDYLEVETLGPLELLAPGGAAVHTEQWTLFRAQPAAGREDEQRELLDSLLSRDEDPSA